MTNLSRRTFGAAVAASAGLAALPLPFLGVAAGSTPAPLAVATLNTAESRDYMVLHSPDRQLLIDAIHTFQTALHPKWRSCALTIPHVKRWEAYATEHGCIAFYARGREFSEAAGRVTALVFSRSRPK